MGATGDRSGDALKRRRRAVLVADLIGSVAMIEADEEGSIARWLVFMAAVA